MNETSPSKPYAVSLYLGRDIENALKAEQARRYLSTGKKPTVRNLAVELLSKAALALAA